MAESGNTADLASMIGNLIEAMDNKARQHAEAERPKLPGWLTGLVLSIAGAVLIGLPAAFAQYGSLQNRVSNLENAHPEGISALAAEVHSQSSQIAEMQRRLNDFLDRQVNK